VGGFEGAGLSPLLPSFGGNFCSLPSFGGSPSLGGLEGRGGGREESAGYLGSSCGGGVPSRDPLAGSTAGC
jgi:hypothetical protein